MALVASAFAFAWSKWNLESGEDQVVFKVRSFRPNFQGQTSIETYHTRVQMMEGVSVSVFKPGPDLYT